MKRIVFPALIMAVMALPAAAADKVEFKKLKGTWTREANNAKLLFKFEDEKKMKVELTPPDANETVKIEADYALDKDGKISGSITKTSGDGGPQVGDKFSFTITLEKDTLKVADLESPGGDNAKQLVEGEYKRKTD